MEEIIRINGCLPGKKDIRDYKINKKAMALQYPESFKCDIIMPVKDQGRVGSCVAHSSAEILEYHEGVNLSTNFIYGIHNKLYGSEGPGMYLREACKIINKYGDPAYDYCPGNSEVTYVYEIANKAFENDEVMKNASMHKAKRYARLFTADEIKYALMNYGPVLIAIDWYDDNKLDKDFVMCKGTKNPGGHALMLYGWDEKGWLIQNS